MAISIKITPDIRPELEQSVTIRLEARRSLNGDILIFDHEDIDIVLMPESNKCIAFAKNVTDDKVYGAQDRLFSFLYRDGILDRSTIRGGNVYGSIEAKIHESKFKGIDSVQATLFSIYKFIQEERPYFIATKKIEDDQVDHLVDPEDEFSTPLGKVPQKARKGSMSSTIRPYGYQYNYSLIRESEDE
jgi:hypothetical protein